MKRGTKIVFIVGIVIIFIIGIVGGIVVGKKLVRKEVEQSTEVLGESKDSIKNEDSKQQTTENEKDVENTTTEDNVENKEEETTNQADPFINSYSASVPEDDTRIHRYDFVVEDCTWQEAYQACIDQGGYLVRINTNQEYEYLRKEISARGMTDMYFKLGGRRDRGGTEYYWTNQSNMLFGEQLNKADSWAIDEWKEGEPALQGDSLFMNLYFSNEEKRFVWKETPDDMLATDSNYEGKLGYICEYNE